MEIRKGDIVTTPEKENGMVLGVSMKGRATVRTEAGVVIAIDVKELKKIQPNFKK